MGSDLVSAELASKQLERDYEDDDSEVEEKKMEVHTPRVYVPDLSYERKTNLKNREFFSMGAYSYCLESRSGQIYEVFDSFDEDSSGSSIGNVLFHPGINMSIAAYKKIFFGLKSRGYRVISIARPGMERSELHYSMNPQNIISDVVDACVQLMDTILRQEGDARGYHVVGHSFGASIALLMALR